ncbi:hypothetical protein QJQ45_010640 [Haematococcus lacustris]|nr:hypothetical protein QJQ45_010640 [Haematococcus lacustris]
MEKSSTNDVSTGRQLPGLQGLPEELLDVVLRQLDASSRLHVFRTSKLLATALLRVAPRIQLTYPTQHDIQRDNLRKLAPFLTEVLRNRQQPKLHLTLQLADDLDKAMLRRTRQRASLVARMLGAVPLCGAVDCLAIGWREDLDLPWKPVFSAALAASFPSLTSLTFRQDGRMRIGNLATVINHPLLLPRLLHLDLEDTDITADPGRSPFIGSRLQELSLSGWVKLDEGRQYLSALLPLPPHLTQLTVTGLVSWDSMEWEHCWNTLAEAVSSLTQLQRLKLCDEYKESREEEESGPGPMALLQALAHLPSLHTLLLDDFVVGQEQLTALLALTQITRLEVYGFSGLTSSHASADCNWRRLEIWDLDWVTAAYLPLHSLTHPLHLHALESYYEEPSIELLAAAELNLCERNKAGLEVEDMWLSKATTSLLTELYLSHNRCTAQQPRHPTVASSSHSRLSASLASSSSPEGHITPGGPGSNIGQVDQQGSPAGGQAIMQRLGCCVKLLRITVRGLGEACRFTANQEAFKVLFPTAKIVVNEQR